MQLNCKVIKKWQPPFSGLYPLSSEIFGTPAPPPSLQVTQFLKAPTLPYPHPPPPPPPLLRPPLIRERGSFNYVATPKDGRTRKNLEGFFIAK